MDPFRKWTQWRNERNKKAWRARLLRCNGQGVTVRQALREHVREATATSHWR